MADLEVKMQALLALQTYAMRPVVFMLDGPLAGFQLLEAKAGSGLVLRTPRGRTVVLTARHNFDDLPQSGMSIGGRVSVADALGPRWEHPNPEVDIAITGLKPDAEQMLSVLAVPTSVVAASSDTAFTRENPMILCGFPALYRRTLPRDAKTADHEFSCMSYATTVEPDLDSEGRYLAEWKEGALTEKDPVLPAIKPGETFEIVHPRGISGGPLWRFRSTPEGQLWSPEAKGMIVGIATDYRERTSRQLCPSVAVWGDWFSETVAAIDAS
jgi:hypothetical protein